ncbi:T-cell surface glycoprotein CD1b isoform X2 [Homo sapiens]|uniref:T-cell surface glycoprotein CD1b isoform X2 n=1 Tax=Homo sapiens TaxID=9606 RepID=UPI0007DC66F0|nr:T-cell surface glycoprotein CD1b isoform X2 [Homo sapiens]|eukprot:XP_016858273.1 T-cell surface glycoprotein CD1b isoform X2 [Homo sapiens]
MLLLPFQLLAVLFPGGNSEHAFQGPTSFHVIQTSSFTNSTWAQTQGSGWLDDLQIHGWDSDSGTAIFLKPWSKGNFSDKEVAELEEIFRVYIFGFAREVQDFAGDFQMKYPFEIQGIAGCELHSGGAIVSFLRGALGGLDFLSVKNASCVPSPEGGSRAQKFCALIIQYQGIMETVRILLYETCPRYLLGVLNAGKADLQRQGHRVTKGAGESPRASWCQGNEQWKQDPSWVSGHKETKALPDLGSHLLLQKKLYSYMEFYSAMKRNGY